MSERKEIAVKEWIENFNNGKYDSKDIKVQCEAGWYDRFCRETSLAGKTKKMGNIIKKITSEKILNNMYILFKNCYPFDHPLYDQFKFCDLESNKVQYCINIDCGFDNHKYAVYCEGFWEQPIFETDSVKELREFLNKQ